MAGNPETDERRAPPSPDEEDAAARALRRTPARKGGPAVGLGLLGVALGLGKLLAPRALARLAGAGESRVAPWIVRGLGARELVVGLGLLTTRRPARWLWARVAGDAVELALLGAALRGPRAERRRLAGALGVLGGVTALDAALAVASTRASARRTGEPVRRSVTIGRPRDEVYRFWRDFANLPAFMAEIESVEVADARRSRWSARGPVGPVVTWEVDIVEDRPDELLRWCSVEGGRSDLRTDGVVRFEVAPGGRGTEVHLELGYGPADAAVQRAASFVRRAATAEQIEADLGRCKQLLETGHVVRAGDGAGPDGVPEGASS
jgi:uncharacterized membrane protein